MVRLTPTGNRQSDVPQIRKAIAAVGSGGTVTLSPRGPGDGDDPYKNAFVIDDIIDLKSVKLCGESTSQWDDDALPLLLARNPAQFRETPVVQLHTGGELINVRIATVPGIDALDATRITGVAAVGNSFRIENVKVFAMWNGIATGWSHVAGETPGNGDWNIINCYVSHADNRGMILRGCNSKGRITNCKFEMTYLPLDLLDNGALHFDNVFFQGIREANPKHRDCAVYIKKWKDPEIDQYRFCEAYFNNCQFTDFAHGIRIRDSGDGGHHRLGITNSTYIGDGAFVIDWAPGAEKSINSCPNLHGNSELLVRLCSGPDPQEAEWRIDSNGVFFPQGGNFYRGGWGEDINI